MGTVHPYLKYFCLSYWEQFELVNSQTVETDQ